MYVIKKTRLGVKHWRLQLQDKSGGVVFTAFYKDFALADSVEHFKQAIKEKFSNCYDDFFDFACGNMGFTIYKNDDGSARLCENATYYTYDNDGDIADTYDIEL